MIDSESLCQGDGSKQSRAGLEAIAGQCDGVIQQVGPRPSSVLLVSLPEQSHCSGNADGLQAAGGLMPGQCFPFGVQKIAGATALRCRFTAVEHLQLPPLGVPVEQESATAKAGTLRFHHRQDRLSGNESIHGMSTSLKSRQCRSAGMRMGRHHHGRSRSSRNRLGRT